MRKFWIYIGGGVLVLSGLLTFCLSSLGDDKLHVFMLDVGQGDALLIQTPWMERILVDGGPHNKVISELSNVLPFYEHRIDTIFLSHPHADHLDGLVEVLKRYDVGQVLMSGVSSSTPSYKPFLELIAQKRIPVYFVQGTQDFSLHGIIFDVVYPTASLEGVHFENLNNSSLVFRLLYGTSSFYFSGDLEIDGETKLLHSGQNLKADILKVGHHGSRTSSSEALLQAIKPKLAFISCGAGNLFKHPHPETLQHLRELGIKTLRTDLDSRIDIVSDGKELTLKGEKI